MDIDIERLKVDRAYWLIVAPEDATHYTPETRNNRACWWINFSDQRDKALCLLADSNHDSWSMEDADEDERGVVIPRPQAPEAEWVDGLPVVGLQCWVRDIGVSLRSEFVKVIPLFYSDQICVFQHWASGNHFSKRLEHIEFLTNDQKQRDETIAAAERVIEFRQGQVANSTHLEYLYDVGLLRLPEAD